MSAAKRSCVLLAALTAFVGSPAFGQVTATKLNPLDEWQVSLDDGLCTLTRQFGRATAPTTLQLRNRDPWNGGFQVAISSERFALTDASFTAGWLPNGRITTIRRPSYESDESAVSTVVFSHGLWDGTTPDSGTPEYEEYWSRDEEGESVGPARFKRNIETFFVNGAFDRPLLFATGPMKEVIEARDACIVEMLQSKGIDPSIEKRDDHLVEMTNARSIARLITRRAPSSVRYVGNWGGVSFLVFLDADANVTSCNLVTLPYDVEFENFGCGQLEENARFRFKDGEEPQPAFYKLHMTVG